jgi:hypothetical protein
MATTSAQLIFLAAVILLSPKTITKRKESGNAT